MKAIFLDRDGVINKYPGDTKYVTSPKEFKFLPGVKKAICLLSRFKYSIFIISNQAGVAKGIYSQQTLDSINNRMFKEFKKVNARIAGVYYCTHHSDANCSCRKPRIGLVKSAVKGKDINLKKTFFVGDTMRDIHTAKAAGCKSILVLSGKEKLSNSRNWDAKPDYVFKDLFEAVRFIREFNTK